MCHTYGIYTLELVSQPYLLLVAVKGGRYMCPIHRLSCVHAQLDLAWSSGYHYML